MKIKAYTKYDFNAYKALYELQMLKGNNPRNLLIWAGIIAILIIVNLAYAIARNGITISVIAIFTVGIAILLVYGYMFYFRTRKRYDAANKYENFQTDYEFNNEEMVATTVADEHSGTVTVRYDEMLKVMETSEYFFIYQSSVTVHVVDKSNIKDGTTEELRSVIKDAIDDRYTVCKY